MATTDSIQATPRFLSTAISWAMRVRGSSAWSTSSRNRKRAAKPTAARLAYSVRLSLKDSKWWALALSSRNAQGDHVAAEGHSRRRVVLLDLGVNVVARDPLIEERE